MHRAHWGAKARSDFLSANKIDVNRYKLMPETDMADDQAELVEGWLAVQAVLHYPDSKFARERVGTSKRDSSAFGNDASEEGAQYAAAIHRKRYQIEEDEHDIGDRQLRRERHDRVVDLGEILRIEADMFKIKGN
jgi:hypothetical protein